MVYIGCGVIMSVTGVIWLVAPSPNPNQVYGYISYLVSVNETSCRYAQKVARNYFMISDLVQFLLGLGIHFLHWDRYFLIWLLTFYLFILAPIVLTERKLQAFLRARHELPYDYIKPDKIKHARVKGFKDK